MDDGTISQGTTTVGLDLGDRHTHVCVIDDAGAVIEEARITNTPQALRRRFGRLETTRIILEAGTHSPWVTRLLEDLGHEVIVANPRRLRLIYENDSKCDRVDAEHLARLGRLDPELLHPLRHRSAETQADLVLLRSRSALVRCRTKLINHARGVVKSVGHRLPSASPENFARKVSLHVPAELAPALTPVLEMIAELNLRIRTCEVEIDRLSRERYPETELLRQVPGVGALTALTYVLTVGDPARFAHARAVGSYLGLRPRQRESGAQQPELGITKAGDVNLRAHLVSVSHYILGPFGPDSDLRRWGLALAERGGKGAKKRAVVAVARKLSVLLLRLWVSGEVYEPLRNAPHKGRVQPA